jgi:RNase P subunit RPR2
MRFANWLRRLFCHHQFEVFRKVTYFEVDAKGKQMGELPVERVVVQKCTRCGWIWRQRA